MNSQSKTFCQECGINKINLSVCLGRNSAVFFSAVNGTGRHISRAGFNSLLLRDLLSGDILYNLSIHVPRLSLSAQPMGEDKGGNKAIWSNNESLTVDQGGHEVSVTF